MGEAEAFASLVELVATLRSPEGCPWDRAQTHESLKAACIEEAAEVVAGINRLSETGDAQNLKEELGDLLFQVVLQSQIAKEEGLFSLTEVLEGIQEKMIRRHPHVFGGGVLEEGIGKEEAGSGLTDAEVVARWEQMKKKEKAGKDEETERRFLGAAFIESAELIERAKRRKGL